VKDLIDNRKSTFRKEFEELTSLMENKKQNMSSEVEFMIETFIELLNLFPDAVKMFNLDILHEYLTVKAEEFYKLYKDRCNDQKFIKIIMDSVYSFSYASVSLVPSSNPERLLLFPYMLVSASNYQNFVSKLCKRFRKVEIIDLESFFNIYFSLYTHCKPKITKFDVKLIKKVISSSCETRKDYFRTVNRFKRGKRYKRLSRLGILVIFHEINFLSIGLKPYSSVLPKQTRVPEILKPYIEMEIPFVSKEKDQRIFRFFLLPSSKESFLSNELRDLGLSSRIVERYYKISMDSLIQTSQRTWQWAIDFDSEQFQVNNRVKFDLLAEVQTKSILSPRFYSYLEVVHKFQSVNADDLSIKTGIHPRTIRRFTKISLDRNYIIPMWYINHIGLDGLYQIVIDNNSINEQFRKIINRIPKISVLKSEDFTRYLFFLPQSVITRLEKKLNTLEQEGRNEFLIKGRILLNNNTIERGVNLKKVF